MICRHLSSNTNGTNMGPGSLNGHESDDFARKPKVNLSNEALCEAPRIRCVQNARKSLSNNTSPSNQYNTSKSKSPNCSEQCWEKSSLLSVGGHDNTNITDTTGSYISSASNADLTSNSIKDGMCMFVKLNLNEYKIL